VRTGGPPVDARTGCPVDGNAGDGGPGHGTEDVGQDATTTRHAL